MEPEIQDPDQISLGTVIEIPEDPKFLKPPSCPNKPNVCPSMLQLQPNASSSPPCLTDTLSCSKSSMVNMNPPTWQKDQTKPCQLIQKDSPSDTSFLPRSNYLQTDGFLPSKTQSLQDPPQLSSVQRKKLQSLALPPLLSSFPLKRQNMVYPTFQLPPMERKDIPTYIPYERDIQVPEENTPNIQPTLLSNEQIKNILQSSNTSSNLRSVKRQDQDYPWSTPSRVQRLLMVLSRCLNIKVLVCTLVFCCFVSLFAVIFANIYLWYSSELNEAIIEGSGPASYDLILSRCGAPTSTGPRYLGPCTVACSFVPCLPSSMAVYSFLTFCNDNTFVAAVFREGPIVDCVAEYTSIYTNHGYWPFFLLFHLLLRASALWVCLMLLYKGLNFYISLLYKALSLASSTTSIGIILFLFILFSFAIITSPVVIIT